MSTTWLTGPSRVVGPPLTTVGARWQPGVDGWAFSRQLVEDVLAATNHAGPTDPASERGAVIGRHPGAPRFIGAETAARGTALIERQRERAHIARTEAELRRSGPPIVPPVVADSVSVNRHGNRSVTVRPFCASAHRHGWPAGQEHVGARVSNCHRAPRLDYWRAPPEGEATP